MEHFRVSAGAAGERLDKYLVNKMPTVSRSAIKELIDSGRVKVNGKRVLIAKWEMLDGDDVEVRLEGWAPSGKPSHTIKEREAPQRERRETRPAHKGTKPFVNIVYEDKDFLVVEKPAGVVIQAGGEGRGHSETFVDHIKAYLKRKHHGKGSYVRPVHRLDKETSGLMVFATSRVGENLIEQFKKHTVERSYLAIVDGAVSKEQGKIDLAIQKGDFGHGKRAHISKSGGSKAVTLYMVKERYGHATLLRLDMQTGRTHQARVHLAEIHHPIIGDSVYGKGKGMAFERHALHSHVLGFKHPRTGKKMRFISDLPEDMAGLVDQLRGE